MSRLKVLHVTPNGNIGGRERQVYLLMKELSKSSDEIQNDILFVRPEGPFFEACLHLPVNVHSTKFRSYDPRYFRYIFGIFKNYDVVNFWGIDSYLFVLSLLHSNIKIFTLTGPRLVFRKSFLGAIADIIKFLMTRKELDRTNQARLSTASKIGGVASGLLRVVRKEIFIRLLKKCQTVITPSQYMKDIAIKDYDVDYGKVIVISNFIDYNDVILTKDRESVRKEFDIKPSTMLIGTACRFDARKRLDRIVKTMTLLPDPGIKAIIIGNGEAEEHQRLRDEVKAAKLEDRIILPGLRLDIYNYINALDLFILPSDREGFGLVLLEALFLKIPTVVFDDGGGALEIIEDGKTGTVVHSEKELAELIRLYADRRQELKRITENGYRFVTKHFNTSNAGLYNDVFTWSYQR